jgi:hypothetical protein
MKLTPMDAIVSPAEELEYFLSELIQSPLFPVAIVVFLLVIAAVIVVALRVRAAHLRDIRSIQDKANPKPDSPDNDSSCNS